MLKVPEKLKLICMLRQLVTVVICHCFSSTWAMTNVLHLWMPNDCRNKDNDADLWRKLRTNTDCNTMLQSDSCIMWLTHKTRQVSAQFWHVKDCTLVGLRLASELLKTASLVACCQTTHTITTAVPLLQRQRRRVGGEMGKTLTKMVTNCFAWRGTFKSCHVIIFEGEPPNLTTPE